jgi:hypothetical protein
VETAELDELAFGFFGTTPDFSPPPEHDLYEDKNFDVPYDRAEILRRVSSVPPELGLVVRQDATHGLSRDRNPEQLEFTLESNESVTIQTKLHLLLR